MKNTIRYYYNLSDNEFYEHKNYAIIVNNEGIFAFKKVNVNEEYFDNIIKILSINNIEINKIILNKDNKILTKYDNDNYVLMKIEKKDTLDDLRIFAAPVQVNNDQINDLWEKKIQFYTGKISDIGLGKNTLLNAFNYYVGLAENAISIYNRCNKGNVRYVISHRRINYPVTYPVFLDPSNMLIDTISRDISEYIKTKFFSDTVTIEEVRHLVTEYRLNNDEMNILLARLLYPSYFFDLLDKKNENIESSLKKIIEKISDYEYFINSFYKEFQDYNLFIVDWLKK